MLTLVRSCAELCVYLTMTLQESEAVPSQEDARSRIWLFDSKGLVVTSRVGLSEQKARYAHEHGAFPLTSGTGLFRPSLEGRTRAAVPQTLRPPPHYQAYSSRHALAAVNRGG